jgi:hypothetical protein
VSHYSKYEASHKKYQNSEKGIAARKKYMQSEKGKAARSRSQAKRNHLIKLALERFVIDSAE